jgi:hypothetical protein
MHLRTVPLAVLEEDQPSQACQRRLAVTALQVDRECPNEASSS